MADYKFALACWQDKVGSDNATATVSVNGAAVLTDVAVASEDVDTPTILTWESTGLDAPAADGSVTAEITVKLTNDTYIDEDTDRNIFIGQIAYSHKVTSGGVANYWYQTKTDGSGEKAAVTDFADLSQYWAQWDLPKTVTGDQIPTDFWTEALAMDSGVGQFFSIPILGGDDGVVITMPLTKSISIDGSGN